MVGKPIITIKNFSGISDNGVYFLEGFRPRVYNGQSVLGAGWKGTYKLDGGTAGFTNLSYISGWGKLSYGGNERVLMLSGLYLYSFHAYSNDGQIHLTQVGVGGVGTDNYIDECGDVGILTTKKQNILYPSANHIGLGVVGTCDGLSGTTKIVDNDGRNFVNLGLGTTAGINKVYNMENGVEFTITSITTTTSTNDTLNFTAGTSNDSGDMFIAFVDNKFKFKTKSLSNNHFVGQIQTSDWRRSSLSWNSFFYFLNGNYISRLDDDDDVWTSDVLGNQTGDSDYAHKQLPIGLQAMDFATNSEKMLVSASGQNGGFLLLWDGYASGWLNIINLDFAPTSVKQYGNGFIFFLSGKIYFTDGYSTSLLFSLPDIDFRTTFSIHSSGMTVVGDSILIVGGYSTISAARTKQGLWAWSPKEGVIYSGLETPSGTTKTINYGTIFSAPDNSSGLWGTSSPRKEVYCSFNTDELSNNYIINNVYSSSSEKNRLLLYIKLPQKMKINLVELNLSPSIQYSANGGLADVTTVTLSYGQGKRQLHTYGYLGAGSTTSLLKNPNGAYHPAYVGQKIEIIEGENAGQIVYVQTVSGQGTSSEEISISPSLTTTPDSGIYFIKEDLYLAGQKSFTKNTIPDELNFNIPGFYSDKLWLDIRLDSTEAIFIDLHSINIY